MTAGRERRTVIVGGGLAGQRAAEFLRRARYAGEIVLVGDEPEVPYDRPPLSKSVLTGQAEPATTQLRPRERIAELGVELRIGWPARHIDADRSIVVGDREEIRYDAVILATGGRPRTLRALHDLPGVYVLRTLADAKMLREAFVRARRLAVVGAGFIGAEVAASARSLGIDTTLIDVAPIPHAHVFGDEIARELLVLHEAHGTRLRLGVAVTAGEQLAGGEVRLSLSDGSAVEADIVVVGIGAIPNVDWLSGSGLEIGDGVTCDAMLNAGRPDVFAIGDIARWPSQVLGGRVRIEHWNNAVDQARHVATAIVSGERSPFRGSGFFWSDQYDVRLQLVGHATDDFVLIEGAPSEHRFFGLYRDGCHATGAVGMQAAPAVMAAKRAIEDSGHWHDVVAAVQGLPQR